MSSIPKKDRLRSAVDMEDEKPFIDVSPQASEDSDNERGPQCSRKRWISTGLGVVALVACVFAARSSTERGGLARTEELISARQLWESRELAEVATDNMIALSEGQLGPQDREEVRADVVSSVHNLSARIARHYPEAPGQLDKVLLNVQQKNAVLKAMRGLSDPRVQQLGRDIGLAMKEGLERTRSTEGMKRHLTEYLMPRVAELRQLRDDITPPELREEDDGDEDMVLSLDDQHMKLMQTFHNWNLQIDVTAPEAPSSGRRLGATQMGMKFMAHFQRYFRKIRTFAKKHFNLNLPGFGEICDKVDVPKLMTCAASAFMKGDIGNVMKCAQNFMSAAMDVLKSIKDGQPLDSGSRRRRPSFFDDRRL